MNIITGKIIKPQKVVIYGPEGIGKSTMASLFPNPIFIDTEGSTSHLDVVRTERPLSWTMLFEQLKYFKANPYIYNTLIVDTADWAEDLCSSNICATNNKKGIEDFGYGKGYTYLEEEWGRFLNFLQDIVDAGMNVVVTAHAMMRKFEQPDEQGAYDRWELKLQKKTGPLLKEWADTILFANYKTLVINVDGQGAQKGKNKAQGGKRVMYTQHHPCWDAKNRWELPEELPFDYSCIAPYIPVPGSYNHIVQNNVTSEPPKQQEVTKTQPIKENNVVQQTEKVVNKKVENNSNIPKALSDLMLPNNVTELEIRQAVAEKGYYTIDTPIENYDPNFINGVLIGAWQQVFGLIKEIRIANEAFAPVTEEDIPF